MNASSTTYPPAVVVSNLDGGAGGAQTGPTLFCPCLEGLPLAIVETVAALPIHDANGQLLSQIDALVRHGNAFACVFAGDPFRTSEHMVRRLKSVGAFGVANYPTVGILDDELVASLDRLRMGMDREIELLQLAVAAGLSAAAIASTLRSAESFMDVGVQHLLVPSWSSRRQRESIFDAALRSGVAARSLEFSSAR